MQAIPQIDLRILPEDAQKEVYDFFCFIKQRVKNKPCDDDKKQQKTDLEKLKSLKVDSFTPLSRDQIYDR